MIFWLVLLLIVLPFCVVLLVGAPYLPTQRRTIEQGFNMLKLKPGDTLLDLGAGDGVVLAMAAKLGYRAIGYELNPFLVIAAKLRLLKYGDMAQIHLADFWQVDWPDEVDGIFVFLHSRFMTRLDNRVMQQRKAQKKPIRLVSYAFEIPNKKSLASKQALFLYKY